MIVITIEKHADGTCSMWEVDIPETDPALAELLERYGNDGYSVRGNIDEIRTELSEGGAIV